MFPADLLHRAEALVAACTRARLVLATAESCTGGLVAGLLTEVAGSSAMFDRGVVSYSNAAKSELLGVEDALLQRHGAVSEACARAMAMGIVDRSRADIAVSVTGIAGPGGGSPDKPVGLVHFACHRRGGTTVTVERRFGQNGRDAIRRASVDQAIGLFEEAVRAAVRPA